MRNLDIDIYMTNFKGFFDKKPEHRKVKTINRVNKF